MENWNLQNETVAEDFMSLIEQIIELPDESLTEDNVNSIMREIKMSLTKEIKEQAIEALHKEFKQVSQEEVSGIIEELISSQNELIDSFGSLSAEKLTIIHFIFDFIVNIIQEAFETFDGCDTTVHFELVHPNAKIPTYAHATDAGADVYAPEEIVIPAGARGFIVPVGFRMAMETGWEMQVRPRSGMSVKTPLRVSNTPGTIDADYRDEVAILFDNISNEDYIIHTGDRIAQFVIKPAYHFRAKLSNDVSTIGGNREGGFGSTDAN